MKDPDLKKWTLVLSPIGDEWSGRARYAAAMDFYQAGEMAADVLEIYRIAARLDNEDPLELLRRWHRGADWIAQVETMKARLQTGPIAV